MFAGVFESDDEDRESVAILASRDPVFAAAVERRVPLARLENLATPRARLENLATRARLECLATIAGLVGLASVARIVLATICGAIATWIAAAVAFCRRRREAMPLPQFPRREIVCNTWDDFVREVQIFFGPKIPFPDTSDLSMFVMDEAATPQLAWRFMMNVAAAGKYAVENFGCVYSELGIPRTTPRRAILHMLKRYALNFHSDKVNSCSDITEEHKEELRQPGLRILGWKSNIEDELKHYVHNASLDTHFHARLQPKFTVQLAKPIPPSYANEEEIWTDPRTSWEAFLERPEISGAPQLRAAFRVPPPPPPPPAPPADSPSDGRSRTPP